jgi:hypothetical protein
VLWLASDVTDVIGLAGLSIRIPIPHWALRALTRIVNFATQGADPQLLTHAEVFSVYHTSSWLCSIPGVLKKSNKVPYSVRSVVPVNAELRQSHRIHFVVKLCYETRNKQHGEFEAASATSVQLEARR